MRFTHFHRILIAITVFVVAGCAVATVDVDVYKGPLINQEETQNDQITTLVMGAKPILMQLRDSLESLAYFNHPGSPQRLEDKLYSWRTKYRIYEVEYLTNYTFHDVNAEHINEILSLYKDLDETGSGLNWLVRLGNRSKLGLPLVADINNSSTSLGRVRIGPTLV